MLADPFIRRLVLAVTLTAAGLSLAPLVSDVGVRPADGPGTLLGLALSLFGLAYLAVLAGSLLWSLVPWSRSKAERSARARSMTP